MESTFSCWKELGAHLNCRLNRSLRMVFGWLMNNHKMTIFKKIWRTWKKQMEKASISLLHIHLFCPLKSTKYFSQPTILQMLCSGEQKWKFPYMEVFRGKRNKVKTGTFTRWQGHSKNLRKHDMLIIAS